MLSNMPHPFAPNGAETRSLEQQDTAMTTETKKTSSLRRTFRTLLAGSTLAFLATSVSLCTVAERKAAAADPVTIAATALSVLQKLYSANDWINCHGFNNCPNEVVQEGDAVFNGVATLTLKTAYGHFPADAQSLFDRAVRDYARPDLLMYSEEVSLVNAAEKLFNEVSSALDA